MMAREPALRTRIGATVRYRNMNNNYLETGQTGLPSTSCCLRNPVPLDENCFFTSNSKSSSVNALELQFSVGESQARCDEGRRDIGAGLKGKNFIQRRCCEVRWEGGKALVSICHALC